MLLSTFHCWKVKDKHTYPSGVNVRVYDDNWKWADADRGKYRWRDPGAGRGFYRRLDRLLGNMKGRRPVSWRPFHDRSLVSVGGTV